VILFRNTGLDDKAHVEFSRKLGDLDDIRRFIVGNRKLRYDYYELFDAGNVDGDSKLHDLDSARSHTNRVTYHLSRAGSRTYTELRPTQKQHKLIKRLTRVTASSTPTQATTLDVPATLSFVR
jgi:hypothetical protein